jgi:hypothetical protein
LRRLTGDAHRQPCGRLCRGFTQDVQIGRSLGMCLDGDRDVHPHGTKDRSPYVCSDLIKESYVKDTFLPMLRSVPTASEETLDLEFSTPYYTPIRHRGLNRVRIFMRGDRLNPCRFKLDRLYCTLRQEEFIWITRVASSWVAVRVGVLTCRKWNW